MLSCNNLLGSTLNVFFQHDRVELGTCEVIDSNADFLESKFLIESPGFRILFFDVELNSLYFRKHTVALFHQPFSNTLALKLGKDIQASYEQNLIMQMRRDHPNDFIGAALGYAEEA